MEWSEFARRLGRELAALERDTILIVRERDESRHYVQAMREPDRLYAEAVSNNFLDGPLLLTLADEEVMSESGWRPPAEPGMAGPRNWWTELPAFATAADYARLAEVMVTALRDVQAVRRPSDLVYESFHRHGTGLVGLPDLGLDCADPSRVTRTRSSDALAGSGQGPVPEPGVLAAEPGVPAPNGFAGHPATPEATGGQALPGGVPSIQDVLSGAAPAPGGTAVADEIEPRLAEAKERGDHTTYFDLLPTADLVFPGAPGETVPPTISLGAGTYITVFTSPGALARVSPNQTAFRRTSFADLSANWPDPAWQLAINPGLASEIHLDITAVARLGSVRPGSGAPVPPPSGGVSIPSATPPSPGDTSGLSDSDAHTRHDLKAVQPHAQPDQYAPLGVPAQHDEFGAPRSPGVAGGQHPSATPQMPGLPVIHDQFAAPGQADGLPGTAPFGTPQHDEAVSPGMPVPAPRDGFGPSSLVNAPQDVPSPLEMTQHDVVPIPGPLAASGQGAPLTPQGAPGQPSAPAVPVPFDAFTAPGQPPYGPADVPGLPTQGDALTGAGASGQPPAQGDAFTAPGQPPFGPADAPNLPPQDDAFPAAGAPDRLPLGAADAPGFPAPGDAFTGAAAPGQPHFGPADVPNPPAQDDALAASGDAGRPTFGLGDAPSFPAQGDGLVASGDAGRPPYGAADTAGLPAQSAAFAPEQASFGPGDALTVPGAPGQPLGPADAPNLPAQSDGYAGAGVSEQPTFGPADAPGLPAQGDGLAASGDTGQPSFGAVDAAGFPAQGDALAGVGDAGQPAFGLGDGPGLPSQSDVEPLGVADVAGQSAQGDAVAAAGMPSMGVPGGSSGAPGQENVFGVASGPGQPGVAGGSGRDVPAGAAEEPAGADVRQDEAAGGRKSRVSELRDAFAGAGAGRRDSAGLRELDTSGMPVLPGLGAHGTAAMPAAAPVPDAGFVTEVRPSDAVLLRLQHGTALWETDGTGDGTPVAVYDAVGGVWTPVRADALPGRRGE